MRRLATILPLCLTLAATAEGHDIPNARVDRSIQATVRPGRLAIDYEVSLSELTLTRDLRSLIGVLPGADRHDWFDRYGRETGPLNARGFLVAVDGHPLELRSTGFDLAVEEHPRYTFHFDSPLPARGKLSIRDTNFEASEGTSRLALRGLDGIAIRGDDLPTDVGLIAIRPVWQLSDAEERRTRQVEADYRSPAPSYGKSSPLMGASPPPRPSPTRVEGDRLSPSPLVGEGRGGGWGRGISFRDQFNPTSDSPPAANLLLKGRRFGGRLSDILDRTSGASLFGLGLMAFFLGAAHAVQPGHGKTLVAASVVGDRGSVWRGAVLAVIVTVTHTGSVLLVVVGLWLSRSTRYGMIQDTLTRTAGFLIAAIGLWRLGRHLAGYGEHSHEPADPDHPDARGLIGLGVAGGLVPCWDAVGLVILAEAVGRLALGVALLVAFGLGMAAVLIAVGWLAARLRRNVIQRGDGAIWEYRLGIASGLFLATIGVSILGFS